MTSRRSADTIRRMASLQQQVLLLRAIAEDTRLRLTLLLDKAELNVTELTEILGQSQPRISRQLKTMVDAGVLERYQEGNWVLYRTSQRAPIRAIIAPVLKGLDLADDRQLAADLQALNTIRSNRANRAEAFFRQHADDWNELRRLNLNENWIEEEMLALVAGRQFDFHLDLGTGTGRMLQLFAAQTTEGLGIDINQDMLRVARARLDEDDMRHCRVRHGDIFRPPNNEQRADFISIHHVLHFLDEPYSALKSASEWLAAKGLIMIVDFAPHQDETLRSSHHHRRLGFSDEQMDNWLHRLGLSLSKIKTLPHEGGLTVKVWLARA